MRQIVRQVSKNAFSEVLQAAEGAAEDCDVIPDAERVEAESLRVLGADAAVDVVIDAIGIDQGIGAEQVARIGELCVAILIRIYALFVHDRLGEIVENRLKIQQNVQSIQQNRHATLRARHLIVRSRLQELVPRQNHRVDPLAHFHFRRWILQQ